MAVTNARTSLAAMFSWCAILQPMWLVATLLSLTKGQSSFFYFLVFFFKFVEVVIINFEGEFLKFSYDTLC